MNPEQWLSLKWNGGSTMSDRWLNQSKIIHVTRPTVIGLHKCGNFRFICFILSAYFRYIYNNRKKDCHLSNEWQYLSTFC